MTVDARRAGIATLAALTFSVAFFASAASVSPQVTPAAVAAPQNISQQDCDDALFRFLPGYTAYCFGMNKWRAGKYRDGLADLKRAAGWANKNAQYSLGMIYSTVIM